MAQREASGEDTFFYTKTMFEWIWRLRPLAPQQKMILRAMMQGWTLKSHRYLDGAKEHRLHSLAGEVTAVSDAAVKGLQNRGYIHSNQKFPAATYLMTEKGRAIAEKYASAESVPPLTAQNFEP